MELFTPGHLVVLVVLAAILFFGWKQLPDMSRSLGRSLRIFKTEIKGMTDDDKARSDAKSAPAAEPRALEAPRVQPAQQQPTIQQSAPQPMAAPATPQPSATRPRPAPRPGSAVRTGSNSASAD